MPTWVSETRRIDFDDEDSEALEVPQGSDTHEETEVAVATIAVSAA